MCIRDSDFRAFFNELASFAARACASAHAAERKDHFAGSLFPNRHAERADAAFNAVIGVKHPRVAGACQLKHEAVDDHSRDEPGQRRQCQAHERHQMRRTRQDVCLLYTSRCV